jgi:hypothetical protein
MDAKPVHTPMNVGEIFAKEQCPQKPIDAPYQQAVGHVLWPAVVSHPDIQFAVGILARFTHNPAESHWNALKRLIRYVYTTRTLICNAARRISTPQCVPLLVQWRDVVPVADVFAPQRRSPAAQTASTCIALLQCCSTDSNTSVRSSASSGEGFRPSSGRIRTATSIAGRSDSQYLHCSSAMLLDGFQHLSAFLC